MATLPNPLPKLAADPSGRSLGLELPPGTLVDATIDGPWHEPLLWYAGSPARPGDWQRLAGARRTAGLHPLLLARGSDHEGGPEEWELGPGRTSYAGDHDAEDVLADFWEGYADRLPGDVLAPFGAEWPGLAEAGPLDADPDARAAEIADSLLDGRPGLWEPRTALVPARRSADIPAAIGWSGPLNHENDVARLCAVLRSWEDRFGIRVVALTFGRLVVSVAAPPATAAEAEAVAAEHFAFCPDAVDAAAGGLRAYAEQGVLGQRSWSFWWD
ncbi:DUF4253 domain-containing protein [Streptomyces minutiscleroticus]|nr:DUF4253 domain-containing protein [Streptomyces minutiscleroticus]